MGGGSASGGGGVHGDICIAYDLRIVVCPISGGPVRYLLGEFTMMTAAESPEELATVRLLMDAMGKDVHIVAMK